MRKLTAGEKAILRLVRDSQIDTEIIERSVALGKLVADGFIDVKGSVPVLTEAGTSVLNAGRDAGELARDPKLSSSTNGPVAASWIREWSGRE